MKNRTRWLIGLQLGLGLLFVGLGHYFMSALRAVYPLDGLFFYSVAAICFVFAWRTSRREKNAVWAALLDLWRGAWQEVRAVLQDIVQTLRQALPYISTRAVVIIVVAVNILAAIVAVALPAMTWLWITAWGVTIIALVTYLLPRSIFQRSMAAAAVSPARVYAKPAIEVGARLNPIGLLVSIGLLLLGQLLLVSASQAPSGSASFAQAIDDAFQLRLSGDGNLIWPGVMALAIGVIMFAVVTRHSALRDYPPLSIVEAGSSKRRGSWLLLVALGGIVLWLFALKSIAGSAAGSVEAWPWLIALLVIGACWWQIDRWRGVRLALYVERREALLLIAALIVVFVVLAYQIGQIPNSLWGDEGAFFTGARDVAHGAAVLDVFGLGTYNEPAATTIFQSWWITLLGANVTAWRLSSVMAAWLAAIPLYFLVRDTLGKRTAWITLAFYAISPWLLTYARMGYDAVQALLPVVLSLGLTWLAVRRDSRFYAFLAGGAAGLSFFAPETARMAIVLAPLWLAWMWITRRISGKTIGRQLAAVALGIVAVAAPPVVYGMAHAPDAYLGKQFESSFNNVFYARDFYPEEQLFEWNGPIDAGQQQVFYDPQFYVPLIGRGVIRTALAFHLPSIVHENYLVGSLADPFGILYLLGLAWCVARFRRSGYAIWPVWLLLGGFLASALSAYPPRAALLLPIVPALVALSALGLTAGIDVLADLAGGISESIKSYALVGMTLVLALLGLREYFVEMPQQFPPDLDNAVSWEAQALKPGADITLIQPDGVPDNYMPWGIQQFDLGVKYHLIKKADLSVTDWRGLCPAGECRFVYVSADRDEVYPHLAQAFGERTPRQIDGADGSVQLYIYAP
jgi:4-amino-4-deoxy-L-arabinose transferase-like glycosyltransferase